MQPTSSFFSFQNLGYLGILLTTIGWMFYVMFYLSTIIRNNDLFLATAIEIQSTSSLFIFAGSLILVSLIIIKKMRNKSLFIRKKYLIILLGAFLINMIIVITRDIL